MLLKLKSIGCMIFCGSQTIGNIEAGFSPDRILEISDQILENNALHFAKNYPNIPIILPSEWENDDYLLKLKKEDYDLFYGNCPCSGLSQISRSASVDNPTNVHFYRTFNAIKKIEPKVFFIENHKKCPDFVKSGAFASRHRIFGGRADHCWHQKASLPQGGPRSLLPYSAP